MGIYTLEELRGLAEVETTAGRAYGLILIKFSGIDLAELTDDADPDALRHIAQETLFDHCSATYLVSEMVSDSAAVLGLGLDESATLKWAQDLRLALKAETQAQAPRLGISMGLACCPAQLEPEAYSIWRTAHRALDYALSLSHNCVRFPLPRVPSGPSGLDDGGALVSLAPVDPTLLAGNARKLDED